MIQGFNSLDHKYIWAITVDVTNFTVDNWKANGAHH